MINKAVLPPDWRRNTAQAFFDQVCGGEGPEPCRADSAEQAGTCFPAAVDASRWEASLIGGIEQGNLVGDVRDVFAVPLALMLHQEGADLIFSHDLGRANARQIAMQASKTPY